MRLNPMMRAHPGLRYMFVADEDEAVVILVLTSEDRRTVLGYLAAMIEPDGQTLMVEQAAAKSGYGPLTYELAAWAARMNGFSGLFPPEVESQSLDAFDFWKRRSRKPFFGLTEGEFEQMFGMRPSSIAVMNATNPFIRNDVLERGAQFFMQAYENRLMPEARPGTLKAAVQSSRSQQ